MFKKIYNTYTSSKTFSVQSLLIRNLSFRFSCVIYFFVIVFWFIGTIINPHNPQDIHETLVLASPSREFPLGNDQIGRDQFSRIASAIPFAISMSISGVLLGAFLGIIFGVSSAYLGGIYERLIIIGTNVALGLPSILLAILVVGVLGTGRLETVLAVSLMYIPEFARFSRVLTGNLRSSGFVVASRLMGFTKFQILRQHVLPNVVPSLVVLGAISLSSALLSIAALSFLGLGVVPPETDLGNMLALSIDYAAIAPWLLIGPSITITLLVVASNFLGDSLSWALDARQSGGE